VTREESGRPKRSLDVLCERLEVPVDRWGSHELGALHERLRSDASARWLALALRSGGRLPTDVEVREYARELALSDPSMLGNLFNQNSRKAVPRIYDGRVLVMPGSTDYSSFGPGGELVRRIVENSFPLERMLDARWSRDRRLMAGRTAVIPWRSTLLSVGIETRISRALRLGTAARFGAQTSIAVGYGTGPLVGGSSGAAAAWATHLTSLQRFDQLWATDAVVAADLEGWRMMLASLGVAGPAIGVLEPPAQGSSPLEWSGYVTGLVESSGQA